MRATAGAPDSLPRLRGRELERGKLRRHAHHRRPLFETAAAPSPTLPRKRERAKKAQGRGAAAYFSGRANTHSMEPLSGLLISGVSVPSDFNRPDPLPAATATYCLPLTL
jgi:hypothetical protein